MTKNASDPTLAAAFDHAAVSDWLTLTDPSFCGPFKFRRIGNGQSNLTFLATDVNGSKVVLRRPPLGRRLDSAHDVGREHRIYSALQSTAVPVPSVIAFTGEATICDTQLLALGYVDGIVIDEEAAQTLGPDDRAAIAPTMVRSLAAIHALSPTGLGFGDLGSRRPYADRQLARWRTQWQQSKTRDLPVVDQVAETLEALIPTEHERVLLHGDFHLLNTIFRTIPPARPFDRGEPAQTVASVDHAIAAILDWELSTMGDPLADLGTLLAYWPQRGDFPLPGFADTGLPGFAKHSDLIADYAAASGRDVDGIEFWHALALWKLAIIAEGVRARSLDDARNTAAGGLVDAHIPETLLARAHAIAAGLKST